MRNRKYLTACNGGQNVEAARLGEMVRCAFRADAVAPTLSLQVLVAWGTCAMPKGSGHSGRAIAAQSQHTTPPPASSPAVVPFYLAMKGVQGQWHSPSHLRADVRQGPPRWAPTAPRRSRAWGAARPLPCAWRRPPHSSALGASEDEAPTGEIWEAAVAAAAGDQWAAILMDHGSRLWGANELLEEVAESFRCA